MAKLARTCVSCKEAPAYPEGKFCFEHDGVVLWAPREGINCDKCEREQLIKRYENFGKEILSGNEKKEPVIDWKKFEKISRSRNEKRAVAYINFLRAIGIFSRESWQNWELVVPGVAFLNPTSVGPLYFTRKQDAIAYALSSYGKALYDWEIRHNIEVITRSALSKKS
jgi:hypothetical protein